MKVRVLYFASLRDAAGRDTEAVEHAARVIRAIRQAAATKATLPEAVHGASADSSSDRPEALAVRAGFTAYGAG